MGQEVPPQAYSYDPIPSWPPIWACPPAKSSRRPTRAVVPHLPHPAKQQQRNQRSVKA